MERLMMLATSDGQWVFPDTQQFRDALGDCDRDPGYDSVSFVVKNLGFVKFQVIGQSIAEIELHPRNVELPALLAVQQQVLCSKVKLFRIKYLDLSWQSEITSSAEQAVSRLSELCSTCIEPAPNERFSAELRDYSLLFKDEESVLRPMLQKWRMSFGQFDPSVISFAIKHQLCSRMMIVGVRPRSPDPLFRFIGEGFFWTDDDYQMTAIGEKTVNQPDKEYGDWVTEFYKSVARTGQPRYDCVSAAILLPGETPGALVTRYERLLLPWKTTSDEIFVTLSSRTLEREAASSISMSSERERSVTRKLAKSS
jgi:hypothetical protein